MISYKIRLTYSKHIHRSIGMFGSFLIQTVLPGALDKQTSLGLAALGVPGFQMFPGGKGAVGLTTSQILLILVSTLAKLDMLANAKKHDVYDPNLYNFCQICVREALQALTYCAWDMDSNCHCKELNVGALSFSHCR